jgi:hypothetical protein
VSRGFPASSPTCTAAPNLKLHMQHSLVCLWSAACYNSNPFFNNNQRQSLCMHLSSLQAATSRENWSSGLLLQPPPQLAARHAIFWTLENRPTKKALDSSDRTKLSQTEKKNLQKNYCRLISESNIKNARSIDLPAGNPPASERGYIGSKQEEAQSESERACARSCGPRTTVRHKTFRAVIQLWKIPTTVVVSFLVPSFGLP